MLLEHRAKPVPEHNGLCDVKCLESSVPFRPRTDVRTKNDLKKFSGQINIGKVVLSPICPAVIQDLEKLGVAMQLGGLQNNGRCPLGPRGARVRSFLIRGVTKGGPKVVVLGLLTNANDWSVIEEFVNTSYSFERLKINICPRILMSISVVQYPRLKPT
jgi:hypothetical protein